MAHCLRALVIVSVALVRHSACAFEFCQDLSTSLTQFHGTYFLSEELSDSGDMVVSTLKNQSYVKTVRQFQAELNKHYDPSRVFKADNALNGTASTFKVFAMFWTSLGSDHPVTVAIPAGVARLNQLYRQCMAWRGPLSAAMHVFVEKDPNTAHSMSSAGRVKLKEVATKVLNLISKLQKEDAPCKLDITLFYEVVEDQDIAQMLFPYNIARNLAKLQARTQLIMPLDGDMMPGGALNLHFATGNASKSHLWKCSTSNTIFIPPAFQMVGGSVYHRAVWADALTLGSKGMVVERLHSNAMSDFEFPKYRLGHRYQKTHQWVYSTQDYPVRYEVGCEPFFVGDRRRLPWFDERFRGYARDKVAYVLDMAAQNFTFIVMADSWVIHRDHAFSKARLANDAKDRLSIGASKYADVLWEQLKGCYRRREPWAPLVNPAIKAAMMALPWWQ